MMSILITPTDPGARGMAARPIRTPHRSGVPRLRGPQSGLESLTVDLVPVDR